MPTYKITNPNTGKTVRVTGDAPPTQADAAFIFASIDPTPQVQPGKIAEGSYPEIPQLDAPVVEPAEKPESGFMDKAVGVAEAGLQALSSLPAAVTYIPAAVASVAEAVVSDDFGTQQAAKRAEEKTMERATDRQEIDKLVKEGIRSGMLEATAMAFATDRGKSQSKTLNDFTGQMQPIDDGIRLMKSAIEQIDAGAESGPIARLFPSFRSATIKLDNIQQNLGLNVLQTTTFGALSASELDLALESTFPLSLQPQELKKFLQDKIAAQEKLQDYLFEAVAFMNEPGNTLDKFLVKRRAEKKGNEPGGTGQTFTGPDNTFIIEID